MVCEFRSFLFLFRLSCFLVCLVIFYCLLVIALEKLFVRVLWGLEWMCLFLRWAISWNTLEQIQGLRATGAQSRLYRMRCKFFWGLAPGYKIFQNRCSCFSFCSLLLFITKTVLFWSFQWIWGEAGQDLVDLDLRINLKSFEPQLCVGRISQDSSPSVGLCPAFVSVGMPLETWA